MNKYILLGMFQGLLAALVGAFIGFLILFFFWGGGL